MVSRWDQHWRTNSIVVAQTFRTKISKNFETPSKKVRQIFEHFGVVPDIWSELRHDCSALFVGRVEGEWSEGRKIVRKEFRKTPKDFPGSFRRGLVYNQDLFDKYQKFWHQFRRRTFLFRKGGGLVPRRTLRRPNAVVLVIVARGVMKVFESSKLLQLKLLKVGRSEEEEQRAFPVQDNSRHWLLHDWSEPKMLKYYQRLS